MEVPCNRCIIVVSQCHHIRLVHNYVLHGHLICARFETTSVYTFIQLDVLSFLNLFIGQEKKGQTHLQAIDC